MISSFISQLLSEVGWERHGLWLRFFTADSFRAMDLTTILKHCHRFPGFV
jgi:hypothetical protein